MDFANIKVKDNELSDEQTTDSLTLECTTDYSDEEIMDEQSSVTDFETYCDKYLKFTDENPTIYHVVDHFKLVLENNGFTYIKEHEPISPQIAAAVNRGGFFFTIRSGMSIVPFVIGGNWSSENGIGAVGSHIDVLSCKLKPISLKQDIDGYNLLGVANYSGSLSNVWFDRDLGIGGSILYKGKIDGKVKRKLVQSSIPIAKIPSLAPHFGINKNSYNKETEMVPIIGYGDDSKSDLSQEELTNPLTEKHNHKLLKYLSKISNIPINDMVELELELYNAQAASRGGMDDEFIFAPRLDDRLCSFAAIYGLIEFSKQFLTTESIRSYQGLNMVVLVDNEEVGSATRTGIKGKFLNSVVNRILSIKNQQLSSLYANSILLSADVTHALNPNFAHSYLDKNYPVPNKGMTIKLDANEKVVTDSIGLSVLKDIAKANEFQLQYFHRRNDYPSGSTIGPYMTTATGSRVVDIGIPILSMHSIRSMTGYKDVGLGVQFMRLFYNDWASIYDKYSW